MHEDSVFVAAFKKEQCLLPTAVASVGLSVHTCMQTATKGSGCDPPVKDILQVNPVAEVRAGETRHSEATSWRSQTKTTAGDKKSSECRCLYLVRAAMRMVMAAELRSMRSGSAFTL